MLIRLSCILSVSGGDDQYLTMKEPWASGNKKPFRLKARKKLAICQFSNLLCDGRPGIIASTSAMLIRRVVFFQFLGDDQYLPYRYHERTMGFGNKKPFRLKARKKIGDMSIQQFAL